MALRRHLIILAALAILPLVLFTTWIVVGSQIVLGLQTIISRSVNITEAPAVVTIGRFTGGNR